MAYFRCGQGAGGNELKILITTTDTSLYGQTITISKDGSTVGTTTFDNQGEAEYTVDEAGLYTVSCGGASESVLVEDEYEVSLSAIPDGSTVTPVNDIQTWLNCAGIFNKTTYTTLSEVLADTTTLLALINSQNAVDYMVRSHDWCDDVCADATAMTYIGANNYAADTLLADDNPGLVPTMTSETTPEGEVLFSSRHPNYPAVYAPYKAFDRNESTCFSTIESIDTYYIAYQFTSPKSVKKMTTLISSQNANTYYDFAVFAGNTINDLVQISEQQRVQATEANRSVKTFVLTDDNSYTIYAIKILDSNTSSVGGADYGFAPWEIKFYAKDGSWLESICNSTYFESVLNVKVPTMTSDTTPSGQCYSTPACSSSYPAYRVFDGNDSTEGSMGTAYKTAMGYYRFTAPVKVQKFDCLTIYETTKLTVKYSDDGTNWNDAAEYSVLNVSNKLTFAINVAMNAHPYWGVERQSSTGRGSSFYTIQFYGRAAS